MTKPPNGTPGVAFLLAMFPQRDKDTGDLEFPHEFKERRTRMLRWLLDLAIGQGDVPMSGLAIHLAECPCESGIREMYQILQGYEDKKRGEMDAPLRRN